MCRRYAHLMTQDQIPTISTLDAESQKKICSKIMDRIQNLGLTSAATSSKLSTQTFFTKVGPLGTGV